MSTYSVLISEFEEGGRYEDIDMSAINALITQGLVSISNGSYVFQLTSTVDGNNNGLPDILEGSDPGQGNVGSSETHGGG